MSSPICEPVAWLVAVLCVLVIFAFLLVGIAILVDMAIDARWVKDNETESNAIRAAVAAAEREVDG